MNYFDVKFFHHLLVIVIIFSLMTMTYNPKLKLAKLFYLFTLIMMGLSGAMSMDQLQILALDSYPVWIWAKIALLTLGGVLPLLISKKFPQHASKLNCIYILFFVAASFLGVYKP